jgi:eukaryotic-like serine/threonine-protein kinase
MSAADGRPATAAESLEGVDLPGGWHVLERIERPPGSTGGFFSVSYHVRSDSGDVAFLKVLDYSAALASGEDPATVLNLMTAGYLFEVEVLELTGSHRLSRVVRALDHGETTVTPPGTRQDERINYLVFEVADGDVRDAIDAADRIDHAWKLRMLHHATNGIRQLHGVGIAHQDLKPSNVLVFNGGEESKVADLGCASVLGAVSPRDGSGIAGDRRAAPPELLYGQVDPDWHQRRIGCDLYHVGSLGVFLFAGQGMTPLLVKRLPEPHRPGHWGDSYSEVLPFVRVAFDEVWEEIAKDVPSAIGDDLVVALRELCDPDPDLRGHPKNRGQLNALALERYVTTFDRLARKMAIELRAASQ